MTLEQRMGELGAWFEIPHPGTLEKIRCATFDEAMNKWFEGFNIPVLVVDGNREDFSKSIERVKNYFPNLVPFTSHE